MKSFRPTTMESLEVFVWESSLTFQGNFSRIVFALLYLSEKALTQIQQEIEKNKTSWKQEIFELWGITQEAEEAPLLRV